MAIDLEGSTPAKSLDIITVRNDRRASANSRVDSGFSRRDLIEVQFWEPSFTSPALTPIPCSSI